MAEEKCITGDKYSSRDGRCCDRCQAGSYVRAECDDTKVTECEKCGRDLYTATKNHLSNCHRCKICNDNQRTVKDCTAQTDTVCECVAGFYCRNDDCDHCQPVSYCTLGEGVKVKAARMNDTICAPCEDGTYSNVTDFHSPCHTHTRCEDIGRQLKTPGTRKADAVCGDLKNQCHWVLPAGLWSGLVLTSLVLLGLICWRGKRKSYRAAASSCVPVTLIDMIPAAPPSPLDLPLPLPQQKSCCQESCKVDGCELLYNPDGNAVSDDAPDSLDSCLPITPMKFTKSTHGNGSAGYCTGNFLRTYSEPQEDEWCGT